jgi:hypothetical protein
MLIMQNFHLIQSLRQNGSILLYLSRGDKFIRLNLLMEGELSHGTPVKLIGIFTYLLPMDERRLWSY